MSEAIPQWELAANTIAESLDADVLLINCPIYRPLDLQVLGLCRARARRKNLLLLLVTEGGDPDGAYRVARCLQNHYKHVSFFVTGYCKSAGTLVALGAHELVVADSGELGPLDVQMSKPDELNQTQSGLTATAALSTLHGQAFQAFESFFLQLVKKSGSSISTKAATQIAVQLACGLFSPLYAHIDPMHVGEAGRALLIAQKYGHLLNTKSNNLQAGSLGELTAGYPSHGFVIDRLEIERLFKNVRQPSSSEQQLIDMLEGPLLSPVPADQKIVAYLSRELPREEVLPGMNGSQNDAQLESERVVGDDPKES